MTVDRKLKALVGRKLISFTLRNSMLKLCFEDGEIEVGVGDSGTMRGPELYFHMEINVGE